MTCQELSEYLCDYVGGELVVEVRQTVEVHVAACERCGVLVHSYSFTTRIARTLPVCRTLPPAFEARLRALIEPELNHPPSPQKPPQSG